jgi:hypothetical protein
MSTADSKSVANAEVRPLAHHSPSRDAPRSAAPCILLEDGCPDHSSLEGDDLVYLFNSRIGQLFWANCERVCIDTASERSCVVISAFNFSEIVIHSHTAWT